MEIALYVHLKSCKIHVLRAQIWSIKDESNYKKKMFSVSISISIIKPDASGKRTKVLHYISLPDFTNKSSNKL